MLVRLFRHGQVRVGTHGPRPGPQDVLGALEAEVEIGRQVVVFIRARP